jgi:anti-anti-sigma factor
MEISSTVMDQYTVVRIEGNLDTNTAPAAQEHLEELRAGGADTVVMDLSSMDYISSAGLRILLVASKKLRGTGGQLRMFALNETVQEIFDISGFSTILSVFPTEAEALEGL